MSKPAGKQSNFCSRNILETWWFRYGLRRESSALLNHRGNDMAILDQIYGTPLSVQLIPQVDRRLAGQPNLRVVQCSFGLSAEDNDDATYVAIDEATKMADVEVVYARSFYEGAKHSSGLSSDEIMAILAGPDPA